MRLRGIEMQGFKSFPDRTKLTFDDGITAIVGPNGSGKSNISDAVRWVFGEQSIKTLRGNKMEDVIFGGTQQRKSQGFAWVSLIIDNTDRSLEIDEDEVIITRKLYRSGESEYRINNNAVRLRDVTELFLDTGLGRDGYSIIGQGKIAEIVGAKSTQRREIFEEAAGVAKYRLRKTDAERRLAQSEENLIRLRDILGELESRVEPLRIQAKKAEEFLAYSEERKTLEISLWINQLEKLKRNIKEQDDKILICKNDRDVVQSKIDTIENEITGIYSNMQELAIDINERRARIKELEENLSRSEADIAVKENDIHHNRLNMERINAEIAQAGNADEELDAKIAEIQTTIEQKTAENAAQQENTQELQNEYDALKAKQGTLIAQIEALKAQRIELRQSVSDAKLTNASSASLIEDTINRIGSLKETSEHRNNHLTKIKTELSEQDAFVVTLEEHISGLENSKRGYDLKLESRRQKVKELEGKRSESDKKAGELLSRAQLLSDMEKNLEGFGQSVKYVMKQASMGALKGVNGPISSLISVDDEYSTAIEIALGAGMQNIVVENEQTAKRAISMLSDSKSGRATFLPLTNISGKSIDDRDVKNLRGFIGIASSLINADKKYENIVSWLLGKTIIAEDIDSATLIAQKSGYRFKIVTLDGQVVNPGGSLTGGYVAKSANILGRKNEIDRLSQEARIYTQKSKEIDTQMEAESRELSALIAAVAGIDGELKTAREDYILAQSEQKRLSISLQEAQEQHKQAVKEYDDLSLKLEELRSRSSTSGEIAQTLSLELEQLENDISEQSSKRDSCISGIEELTVKISQCKLEAVSVQKDLESVNSTLELLTQQKQGQSVRLAQMQEQVDLLGAQIAQIEQDIVQERENAEKSKEEVKKLYEDIENFNTKHSHLEQQATVKRQQEKEVTAEKEKLSGELARLEERHLNIMTEYDGIVAKMWDEYELSKSKAEELSIQIEDINAAQRRLGDLKNKIKSLGTVNVSAIEEYKEVSERYTFMKTQIDDIEKSKAELNKIINELTKDMCRIFSEKFEKINQNFSRIFNELFGGGKANLYLTDPTDILESGIEIFVQPPGKLVKNLSALSGGEQAFVAIAIYFAILKVSPAPFCLIDEIEAALDDVNVSKFASYLRRMTNKTQFIAITHRRGTMEEADVLYGVTMQEEGVSKLLKLNVSEIEAKLGIK